MKGPLVCHLAAMGVSGRIRRPLDAARWPSSLSAHKTLAQIGVPRATLYRWYGQYQTVGQETLEDSASVPSVSG